MEAAAMDKAKDRDILRIFARFLTTRTGIIRRNGCGAATFNCPALLLNSRGLIQTERAG